MLAHYDRMEIYLKPATMKALLATSTDLACVGYGLVVDPLLHPDCNAASSALSEGKEGIHVAGWGVINVATAVRETDTYKRFIANEDARIKTGDVYEFRFEVEAGTPLRMAVAWSDPPAIANAAGSTLVNDISAELILEDDPQVTWKGNNFLDDSWGSAPNAGDFDDLNNIEGFYLGDPEAGTYVLRVSGADIPILDADDNGVARLGQKFSVVATGNLEFLNRVNTFYEEGFQGFIPGHLCDMNPTTGWICSALDDISPEEFEQIDVVPILSNLEVQIQAISGAGGRTPHAIYEEHTVPSTDYKVRVQYSQSSTEQGGDGKFAVLQLQDEGGAEILTVGFRNQGRSIDLSDADGWAMDRFTLETVTDYFFTVSVHPLTMTYDLQIHTGAQVPGDLVFEENGLDLKEALPWAARILIGSTSPEDDIIGFFDKLRVFIDSAAPDDTPTGSSGVPGVSTILINDDSTVDELADGISDLSDTLPSGSFGNAAVDSSIQGVADALEAGSSGLQSVSSAEPPNAEWVNHLSDSRDTTAEGSHGSTSDESGGVADMLPGQEALGSQTVDSRTELDGGVSDEIAVDSTSPAQPHDDSQANEGDEPPNYPDTPDTSGGITDPIQIAHIRSSPESIAVGHGFDVVTSFSGDTLTATHTVCKFDLLAFNDELDDWVSIPGAPGGQHNWFKVALEDDWRLGSVAGPPTATTTVTVPEGHSDDQWHGKYALHYYCQDPEGATGVYITVTTVMKRKEWIQHVAEIDAIPTSSGTSPVTGDFRITLSHDLANGVTETYTDIKVHLDLFDAQANTWDLDVAVDTLDDITLAADGDADPDATDWVPFTLPFTINDHISKMRVWAEFTEPDNPPVNDGDTIRTENGNINRPEWIKHTGHLEGILTHAPGDAQDVTTPFSFHVTSDKDEPIEQQFSVTLHVDAQRMDDTWAENVWTSTPFTVTIMGDNPSGDTTSNTFAGDAVLPGSDHPDHDGWKAWQVYARFTEPANELNGIAEDGVDIETRPLMVLRKEWITHTLHLQTVATKADATDEPTSVDVTLHLEIDEPAPIAETYTFWAKAWAYDSKEGAWTDVLHEATSGTVTLDEGATATTTTTLTLSYQPNAYYTKLKVQAGTTEPLHDKNAVAEDGSAIETGEAVILRKEWVTHRVHIAQAPDLSSSGLVLTADVSVQTDTDLVDSQTFPLSTALEAWDTSIGDWVPISTQENVATITLEATPGSLSDTEGGPVSVSWPALPSDVDYSDYRLSASIVEPSANADNSVADDGDTISTYVDVARSEWVRETLHVTVPEDADPTASVGLKAWVTTDVDVDGDRIYTLAFRGEAFDATSGQWVEQFTAEEAVTLTGTPSDGETTSTIAEPTWVLPASGDDSRYRVEVSFAEPFETAALHQPVEDDTIRTATAFDQSALSFIQEPSHTATTSFNPGEIVSVYSEVGYTHGADHDDYGHRGATVAYTLRDPSANSVEVVDIVLAESGFTMGNLVVPGDAAIGVWSVDVFATHDIDNIADGTSADFVVQPVIESLIVRQNNVVTAEVEEGTITVEAAFQNSNLDDSGAFEATLTYPNDDTGGTAQTTVTTATVNQAADSATFTITIPADVRGGAASIHVSYSDTTTLNGEVVLLEASTGDGVSTEDAAIDVVAVEQPTRNFHTLLHDAPGGPGGTDGTPGTSATTTDDDSAATEASDRQSDLADAVATGHSGTQAHDSGSQGDADAVPTSGTTGAQVATSADGVESVPDQRDSTSSGSASTDSLADDGVEDELPAPDPTGDQEVDSSTSVEGGIQDQAGSGHSGTQTDDSTEAEADDPTDPDQRDRAEELGLPPPPDVIQDTVIVSAPTRITEGESFEVVTTIDGNYGGDPLLFPGRMPCTFRALGYDAHATEESWDLLPTSPAAGHTWEWDELFVEWEIDDTTQITTIVTIVDDHPNEQWHTKYALVYECEDPEDTPSGEVVRTTIVLERNEWMTHTARLTSLPVGTGETQIQGLFSITLDGDAVIAETYTDIEIHLDRKDLQTGVWDIDVDVATLDDITLQPDGDEDPDTSATSSFTLTFTNTDHTGLYRVWAKFTEPNDAHNNGDTIRTEAATIGRNEWITHTGHLSGVLTHAPGQTSTVTTPFDFHVTSDLDEPVDQSFTVEVHTDAQQIDGTWVEDVAVGSSFLVTIVGDNPSGDTTSTTFSGTADLPHDPSYKAWKVYARIAEHADKNAVAEDGEPFETGRITVERREWVEHTLHLDVAEATADDFLDVSVWLEVDQAAAIAENHEFTLELQAYDLQADAWTPVLHQVVSDAITLDQGATATSPWSTQLMWTSSPYYSKYLVKAHATEPLEDKSPLAEDGSTLTAGAEVLRREWVTHRVHIEEAATDSSSGETLTATVRVETDVDLVTSQSFSVTAILKAYDTSIMDWVVVDTQAEVVTLTISATAPSEEDTTSDDATISWATLPDNPDYSRFQLHAQVIEPTQTTDNSIADDGTTIGTYAEVARAEWVEDVLHVSVPESADPTAVVSVDAWVATDVDVDADRTYILEFRGEGYDATNDVWVDLFTDSREVTLTGTSAEGETVTPVVSTSWTLPASGDYATFSMEVTFTEPFAAATEHQPVEDGLVRVVTDFAQSSLVFDVAPTVRRVLDESGVARYYYPGEDLTVWSEVEYDHGADAGDYATGTGATTYALLDSEGVERATSAIDVDDYGFATATITLPADAGFGVWTVKATYQHDGDTIVDETAMFVVKPLIDEVKTLLAGVEKTDFVSGDVLTVEVTLVNAVPGASGTTHSATLTYVDGNAVDQTLVETSATINGQLLTFSLTVPADVATESATVRIRVDHDAIFDGSPITLTSESRDGLAPVDALIGSSGFRVGHG